MWCYLEPLSHLRKSCIMESQVSDRDRSRAREYIIKKFLLRCGFLVSNLYSGTQSNQFPEMSFIIFQHKNLCMVVKHLQICGFSCFLLRLTSVN